MTNANMVRPFCATRGNCTTAISIKKALFQTPNVQSHKAHSAPRAISMSPPSSMRLHLQCHMLSSPMKQQLPVDLLFEVHWQGRRTLCPQTCQHSFHQHCNALGEAPPTTTFLLGELR